MSPLIMENQTEKKVENEMETLAPVKGYIEGISYRSVYKKEHRNGSWAYTALAVLGRAASMIRSKSSPPEQSSMTK